ncbi:MAG: peptidoglycan endopeptidase [Armatimonadetes bacterium]|nr:peptidoglycan endopeptidase [Armatimonadota bacterium]
MRRPDPGRKARLPGEERQGFTLRAATAQGEACVRGIRAATWVVAVIVFMAAAAPAVASQAATAQPSAVAVHRVREGDTLWGLARRHRTTPERLAAMNGIALEATLQIGQRLKVPAVRGAAVLPSRGQRWATALTALATRHVGVRYRWGGTSPSGFDCSGFLYYVFGRNGVALPRTTFAMFKAGVPVPRDQIQTGDVVFFQTLRPGPSHAGIYLGDGRFVHSSSGSSRVTITPMGHRYYGPRYLGARRF